MRFLILLLVAISTSLASEERALGFACGSISPEIELVVVDGESKMGVAGAKLIFFSQMDQFRLLQIDAMRKAGKNEIPLPPKGTVAYTDVQGRAKLRCTFAFTEITLTSGKKRNETYPEGQFRVECEGYSAISLGATELYPSAPYLAELGSIRLVLKKEPGRK